MAEKEGAYSWCKAPRLGGQVVETGALARQMVAGHPLARDMVARDGGTARTVNLDHLQAELHAQGAIVAMADTAQS